MIIKILKMNIMDEYGKKDTNEGDNKNDRRRWKKKMTMDALLLL